MAIAATLMNLPGEQKVETYRGLEPGVAEDMHKRLQELVGEMKGARQERAAKP